LSLRNHRKKGNKKEFSPSYGDEGGFGFADLGKDIGERLMNPLSEKDRKKVEKLQQERRKKEEKERREREAQRNKNYQKGGSKMYNRRPLRPEDARSVALQEAAKKVVEAEPKGKESEEYKKAKSEFDKVLGIQRIKSPPRFPIKETLNTAHFVQRMVVTGKINRNVLFLIVNAIDKKHLGYLAVAINNVRQALMDKDKDIDFAKEGVSDRADYENVERLLELLTANELKREREYLAKKVPFQVYQKIEARIARKLILEQKPELAAMLPELSLDRKVELTKEYVGKVLGGLQAIGSVKQYGVLTGLVPEGWRRPVKLTVPKEKVERPSEKEKETVKEKPAPTAEKKDEKPKDKPAPVVVKVVKKVPEKKEDKPVKDKSVEVDDETLIDKVKGLPALAAKSLKAAGFNTVGDLREVPWERIVVVDKVGKKSQKILESLVKVKK